MFHSNKSYTLPCENRKDIYRMAISPNGILLLSVDEGKEEERWKFSFIPWFFNPFWSIDGMALLINFPRKLVLHHFNFKERVEDVKFSPNGDYIAITHRNHLQIWMTPGTTLEFAPFVLYRTYPGHYDDVIHICWSPDSRYRHHNLIVNCTKN
jgi:periodic tryptophan protein 2